MENPPNEVSFILDAAKAAHDKLPDHYAFILLAVPIAELNGDKDAVTRYTSNVKREDAIRILKSYLFRIGQGEDWMKTIK